MSRLYLPLLANRRLIHLSPKPSTPGRSSFVHPLEEGADGAVRQRLECIPKSQRLQPQRPSFRSLAHQSSQLNPPRLHWRIRRSSENSIHLKGGQSYTQQNIIVSIEGQDPTLKDELVILGAHYDTSGSDGTPRRPGRMITRFNHTLEFHFYTANEGQKGSADVAFKYKQEGKKIRGMVNFDSLGFKSGDEISIGFVESLMLKGETVWSPALTSFVKMLVENYLEWKIKPVAVDCSSGEERCSSDYISWHRENHPWAAVTEVNENPHLNTENDSIEKVNFEQVNEFAKLALAVTIELGELALTPHIPDASWSSAFNSAPGCGGSESE
ncbi:putative leucine aminopeptidase 1 [Orchesella cincta]|uniref:Putative leucine aminopeptidase 1 n=1 Tax=Orchesella cincta TaxID=48709 RepID=A0A1D2M1J8_ORCCI|nr:putative leucine aminopeptidase 1 [Orchesella cincta]